MSFPISSLKSLQMQCVFYPENGDYFLSKWLRFACSIVADELEDEEADSTRLKDLSFME